MAINLGDVYRKNNNQKRVGSLNLSVVDSSKVREKEWWEEIFQAGAFQDGYDFGDVTKTILGTAGDIGVSALKGVTRVGENIGDLAAYTGAQVIDWFGADDYADQVRDAAREDLSGKIFNGAQEWLDDYSVIGNTGSQAVEMAGYSLGLAATGNALSGLTGTAAVGNASTGLSANLGNIGITVSGHTLNIPTLAFVGGMAGNMGEAYQKENVTDTQAWLSGLGGGTIEGITEGLFGWFGVGGSSLDDAISKTITNQFKSGIAKTLANVGVHATGEAVEEFLSYAGNQSLDWLIDKASKDGATFYEDWDWNAVGEEMAVAFLSAGLSQGGSNVINTTIQSNNAINVAEQELGRKLTNSEKSSVRDQVRRALIDENTLNEQKVIDSLVEQYQNNNQNLSQKDITDYRNEVTQNLRNGNLNIQDIENVLGNISTNWTNTQKQINELQQRLETTQNSGERTTLIKQIESLQKSLAQDSRLQRSYYETSQRRTNYVYEQNESDSNIAKSLKESASKVMNNTTRTRDFVENVSKIAEDTNTIYEFTNNEQLSKQGYNLEGKTVNGLVTNDGKVLINIDSPNALNRIIGHETTHLLEGTSEYQDLQDMAIEYAKTKGEYDSRLEAISDLYKGLNANINNELTSDLVGDYIFDTKFINDLATQKPTLFRKIYNYVRHISNLMKANSKEARQLENLKYKFQKAYLENVKNSSRNNVQATNEVKYSIKTTKNGIKYIDVDTNQDVFNGINPKNYNKIAKMYINDYLRGDTTLSESDNVIIDSTGARKYTNPGKRQSNFTEKMKLAPELKNVLEISKKINEKPKNKTTAQYDNYEYYEFQFKIDNQSFSGIVNVGIDSNGNKHFYEINNIKKTSGISETSPNRPTGFSDNNISQNSENVKSTSNKYSLSSTDNQGRALTKEQQEYFKDSKVRDENGNLQVVYHGSPNQFTQFSYDYIGSNGTALGKGFYLTDSISMAEGFTGNGNEVMELYANITKPMSLEGLTISKQEFKKFVREIAKQDKYWIYDYGDIDSEGFEKILNYAVDLNYDNETNDVDLIHGILNTTTLGWENGFRVLNKTLGYDGVIKHYDAPIDQATGESNVYVPFFPEQIKNVDNLTPTSNKDIRYSLSKSNDIAPMSDNNIYGRDVKVQVDEAISPLSEKVDALTSQMTALQKALEQNQELDELFNEKINEEDKFRLDYLPKDPTRASSYEDVELDMSPFAAMVNASENRNNNNQPLPKVDKHRTLKDAYELLVNRNAEIDRLANDSGNQAIKYAGDMLNSAYGEAEGNINVAQTDSQGNIIGESLSSLFQKSKSEGYYEALDDYLKHYSNIDRHIQGKGSTVSEYYSRQMVVAYEEVYPFLKDDAEKIWKYGDNILKDMANSGLIDQELYNNLRQMYPHYVPYMWEEDIKPYMAEDGEVKPKPVLRNAEGGAKYDQLIGIEKALTEYTYAYKRAIRQNGLYQQIVNTLTKTGNEVQIGADTRTDPTQLNESLYRDENGNYLTAYVDGKQKSVRVSDELYRELSNDLDRTIKDLEQRFSKITNPLQKVSQVRRNLLTSWNPTFILTNAIKDIQDATFNSKYTTSMLKNYPGAFVELFNAKTNTAKQFLALYGSGNLMGEFNTDSLASESKIKNIKFFRNIAKLNNVVELAPRFAEYKASLENGATIQEALYNAREITTNFGRGGVITKALNRNGATFLNASVQGFDKFIRNFSGQNGAKGVVNAMLKAVMFGVAPALFNHLVFGLGDDKDEDYEALPDYVKDNYYLIKTDDGKFIRIPKGRSLSIFGSAARRTLEFLEGEEDAFEGYLNNAMDQIGPNNPFEENIFSPLIQAANNETWYGGDIVSSRLQKMPDAEQYDESTDAFSIWLGGLIGISPAKINYVLDQYSGGIGDVILPMITEEATSDGSLLAPLVDKFTVNTTSDNKYVSDIYSLSDELVKNANSMYATDEDVLKNKYVSSITGEMGQLYSEIREVQNSDLSKAEKYKKVQTIKDQINSLAEEGLNNYENLSKTSNYAIINDKEFYKYYNSSTGEYSWTSPKEDELSDLNSMGMDIDEKSEYFKSKESISNIKTQAQETEENSDITKQKIAQVIINANLTSDEKYYLYDRYYGNTDTLNVLANIGLNADDYILFDTQNFEADKNQYGETISGSKKAKVFNYINSMDIDFEHKVILAKLQYKSYDEYNYEIIDYLNNSNITYEEEVYILEALGFKVYDDGTIEWE